MAFFHSPLPSRSEWTTIGRNCCLAVRISPTLRRKLEIRERIFPFFFFEIEHRSINRDTKDDDRRTLTLTREESSSNIRLKIRAFDESILPHPTWRTRRKKHGERERERESMVRKSVQLLAIATNLAAAGLRLSNFEPCENFILYRV